MQINPAIEQKKKQNGPRVREISPVQANDLLGVK